MPLYRYVVTAQVPAVLTETWLVTTDAPMDFEGVRQLVETNIDHPAIEFTRQTSEDDTAKRRVIEVAQKLEPLSELEAEAIGRRLLDQRREAR